MKRAVLDMLAARLRAPPPRVRLAGARELAGLIRKGDPEASAALLRWIAKAELESEAVTGLGVIHAFALGQFFDAATVASALVAPSLLSDWQLHQIYPNAALPSKTHAFGPEVPAELPPHQLAWFREGLGQAIPLRLVEPIRHLARDTGVPLLELWRHEWAWLQATSKAPLAAFPYFLMGEQRGWTGAFDLRQRDLYVSSYLRMLAAAIARFGMPREMAETYSLTGLSFSPGVAELHPLPRPAWTRNLAHTASDALPELCRRLVAEAAATLEPSERLVALHAGDFAEDRLLDVDIRLVLEPVAATDESDPIDLGLLVVAEPSGQFSGVFGPETGSSLPAVDVPTFAAQSVWPQYTGSTHGELVARMRLAAPDLFARPVQMTADARGLRLEAEGETFSCWRYWLAEWDAGHPTSVAGYVGSVTTVARDALKSRLAAGALCVVWRATVVQAVREESYKELASETLTFRITMG